MTDDQPYTKREIDLLVETIEERDAALHKEKMAFLQSIQESTEKSINNMYENITQHIGAVASDVKATKLQAEKTNGRVSRLELWRSFLLGAWAVLSMVFATLILPEIPKLVTLLK